MNPFIFIIPIYTAFASRVHGGGFMQGVTRILRNFLFALPFAFFGNHWLPFITAFFGIDLGHYQFWFMGMKQPDPRTGEIEFILRPITKFIAYGSLPYCIIGLMIKGAFIASGTLNAAVIAATAVLWMVAYWIGMRTFNLRNDIAEALSGLFAGIILSGLMSGYFGGWSTNLHELLINFHV